MGQLLRLGINKCGTGLWASEPVRHQTYAEVEWVTWDKAKSFTNPLSAQDIIRDYNLQDCEVLPLADPTL